MAWNIESVRAQFPALQSVAGGRCPVFLDGPGGSQVPSRVISAISECLSTSNANLGGGFVTSWRASAIVEGAHAAMADFLNAESPEEIVFGANMTTLTFHLSRSIARILKPGDEVVVTRLDHEANVSPWVLAARDAGATVRWVDIGEDDCTLDLSDFERALGPQTRWVAIAGASNLVGSINDVERMTRLAHAVGAWVFVDAVHAAPHLAIDVQKLGCDFLVCSVYKFFGPHVGVLWGKRKWLEEFPAYKLRVASDAIPDRWMTGTQNHEGLAGVTAAVDYLAGEGTGSRRDRLKAAFARMRTYEEDLSRHFLELSPTIPGLKVWGITDSRRLAERVPTFALTFDRVSPRRVADFLAERQIYAWHGNMYAIGLTERLGLEASGGVLRVGLMHYNTHEEVEYLVASLREIVDR